MNADTQLQTNVLDELKWRPSVNSAHIGVTAKNGVVTLTGQVAHYAEKSSAEEAAKGVYGVQGLANDITVEIVGTHKRTDQDLAEAALNAMKWDYEVPNDKVKIVVKNGWLTLTGTLDWQYQKDAAARCVRNLMGVIAVSNDIKIKPEAKWSDVKSKIEDSFRRNADLEARRISVSTDSGTVTLTGSVDSWRERDQATWAAWSAPGVTSVKNEVTITP
jgi:osmotically-inducible protein OsmY